MKTKEITNKAFRKALQDAGLGGVHLFKGEGYFYIVTDANLRQIIPNDSIYVQSFNEQSIEDWVRDIKNLLQEE